MIHEEQGEYSYSDSLFTVILAADSENSTEMNDYAYLISEREGITMEKLDYALKMAQKALQIEPENPMVLDTVGWIYYRQENYEKALEYIQTSIDNGGENAVILEHLGDVYLQLKKMEKALESFQNALEKDPENKQLISKIKILNNE
jgi:tetratricopeptide (TPR) repeat protein